MSDSIITSLFLVLMIALLGGIAARIVKLPPLVGVIVSGIVGNAIFPIHSGNLEALSEIGLVLLLFSVGLETSFSKLTRVGEVATIGSVLQMIIVTLVSFFILRLIGISVGASLFLSAGFALSSTALIVKMLTDSGELATLHGEILLGTSLVQDLAVVPLVVILPSLTGGGTEGWFLISVKSLLIVGVILSVVFVVGKLIGPYLTSYVANTESRELLILGSVVIALGVASLVSIFGVSAALGAFLAGVVISSTQESHAIFAETRPLRDLFSILFFVTLGFLVSPSFVISNIGIILLLSLIVIAVKLISGFAISAMFGVRGKTAIASSIGIAQVGEFAFILYLIGKQIKVLTEKEMSIGVSIAVITLLVSPILFKLKTSFWRKVKKLSLFAGGVVNIENEFEFKDHVILCGYGRMGSWIGKTLEDLKIPYVVIDYSQKVIHDARKAGISAIYGDPGEKEVLEIAGIKKAKAIIISLPDRIAQNEIISYCQTYVPNLKIIARAHLDEDVKKLIQLKVKKVIQPEFEGAIAVIREILRARGLDANEISSTIKSLRLSHSKVT